MPDHLNQFHAFLWGAGGGLIPELLAFYKLRRGDQPLPRWAKSPRYWLITITMIAAGGGVAFLYVASGQDLSPLLAVNVGASAPLILSALSNSAPDIPVGKVD